MSSSSRVIDVASGEELASLIADRPSLLVFFWAAWCGPCRLVHRNWLDAAAATPSLTFAQANFDGCQEQAAKLGVSSIPAFLYFSRGALRSQCITAVPDKVQQFLDGVALGTSSAAADGARPPSPTPPLPSLSPPHSPSLPGVKYEVHYFKAAGRAELIRLLLTLGGADWSNVFVGSGAHPWPESRGNYAFRQLPGLKIVFPDERPEVMLVQAHAIFHYLASAMQLTGPPDLLLQAFAGVFEEGVREINDSLTHIVFISHNRDEELAFYCKHRLGQQLDGIEKQIELARARAAVVAPHLAGGQFLFGQLLTWWDVYALETFNWLRRVGAPSLSPDSTPLLFALLAAVRDEPRVAAFHSREKDYPTL